MASERQLLLGAIAALLCLLVFREISTLKSAEDARPAQPDPAYVHVWKQPEVDMSSSLELKKASASAAGHAGVFSAQRDDLRTTLVHDAGGRLGASRQGFPLASPRGSLDVVFSAPAVASPAVVVPLALTPALAVAAAPLPAAALAWRQGSRVQTARSSSDMGEPATAVAIAPKRARPLTPAAKLLEEARSPASKADAAPKKLKWSSSWGGVGLAKRRHHGSEDSAGGSGEGRAAALPRAQAQAAATAARTNGTAHGGAGGGQLPFSGVFMCHDVSESYGAAWIIHKSKFLKTGFGPPWTAPFDTKEMAKPGWCVCVVGAHATTPSSRLIGGGYLQKQERLTKVRSALIAI
jgi:hypothetical protein